MEPKSRLKRFVSLAIAPLAELSRVEKLVVFGIAVLHVVGIGWGLPHTDAWDVDGIAPRDFLPGVIQTFTPGDYFTYPPLHLALLALLTLPATLVGLAKTPSFTPPDLVATFLSVPMMTAFAIVARVVSSLMSLGIVLAVGRMAKAIAGPRARPWAMAIAGVDIAGTYYAHTTNLDIPALFWACLALLALLLAVEADDARKLRRVGVLAACAISTKDQAYAVFAFSVPVVLAGWLAMRAREAKPAKSARELLKEIALCGAITVGLVLVIDGALFNPTGFAARLRFLTGHASQDYAVYTKDWAGRGAALKDALLFLPYHYPVILAPVFVLGMVIAIARRTGRERLVSLVPLLGILSFTFAFNCVARRVEHRFMLPQMQLVAVYGGIALAALVDLGDRSSTFARWALRGAAFVLVLAGARLSASVVGTMLGDSRYDAEDFLAKNAKPGDLIEVYGSNVYLPRFAKGANVTRVGHEPAKSPLPGVVEVQAPLSRVEERKPTWIVVSTCWAWRFLQAEKTPHDGRIMPEAQVVLLADQDSTDFIRALFAEKLGYRIARLSHYAGSDVFPPSPIHASLTCDVYSFERR